MAVAGTKRASGEMLRVSDFLDAMGIDKSTFFRWRARGKAPRCITLPGGQLRIRRRDYEEWLDSLEQS